MYVNIAHSGHAISQWDCGKAAEMGSVSDSLIVNFRSRSSRCEDGLN